MSPLARAAATVCDGCSRPAERLATVKGTGDQVQVRLCRSCVRRIWVDAHREEQQTRMTPPAEDWQ